MGNLKGTIGLVVTALAVGHVLADEKPAGDRLANTIAPYVDEQTLVVAHLNLMAFDAVETVDWLAEFVGLSDQERDRLQAQVVLIGVVTQTLAKDKSIDAFVVISLADMGRLPFFLVVPLAESSPASAISAEARRQLEKDWQRKLVTEQVGEALVTGSQETIDRLKKQQPLARPELTAAFHCAGAGAVQVAFVPSAALGKLADTIVPELPKNLGGGRTKAFTQGARWVAADIDLPPQKIALRIRVQSADAEAAAALESAVAKLFAAAAELPQIAEAVPEFDELSRRLLPQADGDQLKLELSEDNGGIDALRSIAGPALRALVAGLARR
jgi:hypothetical protein